jgi:site-specific DNA-methyltransferase (adenine-specific)
MLNQILKMDYREFLDSVPSESVHAVVTDPPYGMAYQNNYTSRKHKVLKGDSEPFSFSDLASEAFRIMEQDTAIFCFTRWSEYPVHQGELSQAGFCMKEPLICQKRSSGTSDLKGTFQTNSDWIMFGHRGRFTFRNTTLMKNSRAGDIPNKGRKPVPDFKVRFPSCWFGPEYPWSSENSSFQKSNGLYHPTIKGLEFVKWLILLSTDEGDTVCDPFMGSGTTAEACIETGRNFIGCEIDDEHHETCLKRVARTKTLFD